MVCKIFFCLEFANILEKSQRGKEANSKAIAKHHDLLANAKGLKFGTTNTELQF